MAGLVGFDVGQKRQTSQCQVANQIQRFMAAKFIRKPERAIHDAVVGEDDSVLQRSSANQAHRLERFNVSLKTECARARQEVTERVWPNQHLHFLLADQRMGKINVTPHAKLIGGIDADPAITFDDLQRLEYFQVAALPAQFAYSGLL